MTLYQWDFFDTSCYAFDHVESTSRLEANIKGWNFVKEELERPDIEYVSEGLNNLVSFCSNRHHYLTYDTGGSLDMVFREIEIEV